MHKHKIDIVKDSIPWTLVRLALPLILGNILQQLYNTVDALVIGRYADAESFAAIGISSSVMNLFLFAIVGSTGGISVIFSNLYGRRDMSAFRREHFLSFAAGLCGSSCLSLAGILLIRPVLILTRVPSEVQPLVTVYLIIVFLGLPASFLYNMYSSILRAVGKTGMVLMILMVSVFCNLILDLLFVGIFSLGVRGAALATILAQILSAGLSMAYLKVRCDELVFRRADCVLDRELLKKTLRFGMVTGIHQSGLYIGKLLVQGVVNGAGLSIITAYTATTRIEGFANSFGDSGAAATSVVVAQNLGAGKEERVRKTFWNSLWILTVLGILCSILMYITAGNTTQVMLGTSSGSGYHNATEYICLISVFYVFCFTGNTFAGYFDGIGKVWIPLCGALSHITMRIILSGLWIHDMGLPAVALASGIGWIYVNVFWSIIYYRYQKKRKISRATLMLFESVQLGKQGK